MVSRFPFKGFVFILFFYSPHRWNKPLKSSLSFRLVFLCSHQITYVCLFLLRCLWFSVKMCWKESVVSWRVCVCVCRGGDPWGAQFRSRTAVREWGSASGQSIPCLWWWTRPSLSIHVNMTRTSTVSLLPTPFKELTLKQHILHTLRGLPLTLVWASAPQHSVFTENDERKCDDTRFTSVHAKQTNNLPWLFAMTSQYRF